MQGKAFLDTNVLVYLFTDKEPIKAKQALSVALTSRIVISTQVLQELANVLTKKYHQTIEQVVATLEVCMKAGELHTNTHQTIVKALSIKKSHKFSFYDSLIVAAAIDSGCQTLFSEDLQHEQQIIDGLRVVNPFLAEIDGLIID